jgi:hypothetical protein
MKSYTDIEQSKKLAEILPIESADMFFVYDYFIGDFGGVDFIRPGVLEIDDVPCWSLAALLEVLPERVIMPYYAPYLQKEDGKYHTAYGNDELLCKADNPIDACYEMILKLKEKDLL